MIGNPTDNTDIAGRDLAKKAKCNSETAQALGFDMSGSESMSAKIEKGYSPPSMTPPSFGPPKLDGRSGR